MRYEITSFEGNRLSEFIVVVVVLLVKRKIAFLHEFCSGKNRTIGSKFRFHFVSVLIA